MLSTPKPVNRRELLANRDSPLYDPRVHVSELYATLYCVRVALERNQAPHSGLA